MRTEEFTMACEVQARLIKPQAEILQKQVLCANDVATFFASIWNIDSFELEERFYIAYLNRGNVITGYSLIGIGSIAGVHAEPRKILIHSLIANASSIIVAHNHPSNRLEPSQQDNLLTKKIKIGCEAIGINLLDHMIFDSDFRYYSYANEGTL